MYVPFEALIAGHTHALVPVDASFLTKQMQIHVGNTVVFITKEQAMKFFGLVDPNDPSWSNCYAR